MRASRPTEVPSQAAGHLAIIYCMSVMGQECACAFIEPLPCDILILSLSAAVMKAPSAITIMTDDCMSRTGYI